MDTEELVIKIKRDMGITGEYHDETIKDYIQYVKDFLVDGGVPKEVVNSNASIGAISQGVNDMWDNSTGNFSNLFFMRAIQLASRGDKNV